MAGGKGPSPARTRCQTTTSDAFLHLTPSARAKAPAGELG